MRRALLGLALALGVAGCAGEVVEGEVDEAGSDQFPQTNAQGHLVATVEATSPGTRSSGSYLRTQALDGAVEQIAETSYQKTMVLLQTWGLPLDGYSGPATLKVVARRTSSSGDNFSFGWSFSASGPFTGFCTLTSSATSFKTCRQALSIPAGKTALYVQVADSNRNTDSSSNKIEIDYLAAIPFDCTQCMPGACQVASVCNANETGCTVTVAADGSACTGGTCHGGICQQAACGNGVKESGEACDDGAANGTVASCCGASCQHKAYSTACDDKNACTKNDACSAGTCAGIAYSCAAGTTCDGAGGCSSPGRLLFTGDFETGDLVRQWSQIEQCQPGRISVYSAANAPAGAPAPRQGTYAARFHVLNSDVSPCTSTDNPRAQLSTSLTLFRPGDEVWQAWSVYVPTNFPGIACGSGSCPNGSWMLFQQDYGPPWDGSPSIGWDINFLGGVDSFAMGRGVQYGKDKPWHMPLVKGRWVDFLVHKKFANTVSGGGFVEAWVDKQPITFSACNCTKLMTQTMHSTQSAVGFFINSYRAKGMFEVTDLYFDAVRIGTTRQGVELP
ncbi:MAG: heparin lyase I family protein [Deltaproteobacteria bacterium]|nr:heparin lyase I family protein [Deltaproteobacteria bacterium]